MIKVTGETINKNEKRKHIYAEWLYMYGGTSDVVSFEQYTKKFDDDMSDHSAKDCMFCSAVFEIEEDK